MSMTVLRAAAAAVGLAATAALSTWWLYFRVSGKVCLPAGCVLDRSNQSVAV
jgi:hypothetical protein